MLMGCCFVFLQVWLFSEGAHMEVEGLDDEGASSHSELYDGVLLFFI